MGVSGSGLQSDIRKRTVPSPSVVLEDLLALPPLRLILSGESLHGVIQNSSLEVAFFQKRYVRKHWIETVIVHHHHEVRF